MSLHTSVFRRSFKYAVLMAALGSTFGLGACGDGWEAVRTTEISPYGNIRTAGSTIAYVRKKLLPEKPAILTPAAPALAMTPAPAPVVDTSKEMDKVFDNAQKK